MIRIAIVEDRDKDRQLLCKFLRQYADEHEIGITIETFSDGEDISVNYAFQFDIIFMDIMMQFVDGMSAAEEIRKKDDKVIIIFTTTMIDYAVKGYQVGAFDYILKPIAYYALSKSLERALTKLPDQDESKFILLSLASGKRKVEFKDICWIESHMHYLTFSTKKGQFRTYMRMKDIEQALSGDGFFRINKGIIVNLLKAFLYAEFMASFEWQFSSYYQWPELFSLPVQFLIAFMVYFICCLLFWRLEKREQREAGLSEISIQELMIASAITIVVFVLSNFSFLVEDSPFSASGLFDMFNIRTLFDLMGLVVIYAFQSRILEIEAKADIASMEVALRDQYNKYRNYQDSIELIHLKYHDLKHQLEDLRGSLHDDGQKLLIDHIESELKEYSPQLDTGNAVLNALLDSRRVLCQRKGITVTAVADGRLLSFLSTADLCTIVGNALDNAVECVSEIEDPQKRLIHLEVTSNKGFVLIRVENPVERPVHFTGGLLQSGKAITAGHGLGTRSIQRTVNKLGGNAAFECVNDSFVLRIIFPVSRFLSL